MSPVPHSVRRFVIVDVRIGEQLSPGTPPEVTLHTLYTAPIGSDEERDRLVGGAIDHIRDTLRIADDRAGAK